MRASGFWPSSRASKIPETKRIVIGHEFIAIFEEEAAKIAGVKHLVQGTLYPDVIESKTPESKAGHKIKSHHNVGGLPETMKFTLVEPLRALFKDEVRELGRVLGLPEQHRAAPAVPGPGTRRTNHWRRYRRAARNRCAMRTPSCARRSTARRSSRIRGSILRC